MSKWGTDKKYTQCERDGSFFVGVLVGVVGGFIVLSLLLYFADSRVQELEQCEKKIARDQYCVMIAVPSEYKINK